MLLKVKEHLANGNYTCVLMNDDCLFTSRLRGVKPLVQFVESKTLPKGLWAADKVVGKATAYLYILLGIRELYAKVISESAASVLYNHGIALQYDTLVPYIINRSGDGICPFEKAVMDAATPEEAYKAILSKMKELGIHL